MIREFQVFSLLIAVAAPRAFAAAVINPPPTQETPEMKAALEDILGDQGDDRDHRDGDRDRGRDGERRDGDRHDRDRDDRDHDGWGDRHRHDRDDGDHDAFLDFVTGDCSVCSIPAPTTYSQSLGKPGDGTAGYNLSNWDPSVTKAIDFQFNKTQRDGSTISGDMNESANFGGESDRFWGAGKTPWFEFFTTNLNATFTKQLTENINRPDSTLAYSESDAWMEQINDISQGGSLAGVTQPTQVSQDDSVMMAISKGWYREDGSQSRAYSDTFQSDKNLQLNSAMSGGMNMAGATAPGASTSFCNTNSANFSATVCWSDSRDDQRLDSSNNLTAEVMSYRDGSAVLTADPGTSGWATLTASVIKDAFLSVTNATVGQAFYLEKEILQNAALEKGSCAGGNCPQDVLNALSSLTGGPSQTTLVSLNSFTSGTSATLALQVNRTDGRSASVSGPAASFMTQQAALQADNNLSSMSLSWSNGSLSQNSRQTDTAFTLTTTPPTSCTHNCAAVNESDTNQTLVSDIASRVGSAVSDVQTTLVSLGGQTAWRIVTTTESYVKGFMHACTTITKQGDQGLLGFILTGDRLSDVCQRLDSELVAGGGRNLPSDIEYYGQCLPLLSSQSVADANDLLRANGGNSLNDASNLAGLPSLDSAHRH